jgi:hypothetical protein
MMRRIPSIGNFRRIAANSILPFCVHRPDHLNLPIAKVSYQGLVRDTKVMRIRDGTTIGGGKGRGISSHEEVLKQECLMARLANRDERPNMLQSLIELPAQSGN